MTDFICHCRLSRCSIQLNEMTLQWLRIVQRQKTAASNSNIVQNSEILNRYKGKINPILNTICMKIILHFYVTDRKLTTASHRLIQTNAGDQVNQ